MLLKPRNRKRRGAALVEYALIIAGVALVSVVAVSVFGSKTADMIAAVAATLPGASAADNAPIQVGRLVETTPGADGVIRLDVAAVLVNSNTDRLGRNVAGVSGNGFGNLIVETH